MFVMKCWRQCAAKPQQETGESQESLTWVSLTMENVCFGLSGFGCSCPSGMKVEGREETEVGTLGTVRRGGPWPSKVERHRQWGLRREAVVNKEVNDVEKKWGWGSTSFPACTEAGDSSMEWLLLAS